MIADRLALLIGGVVVVSMLLLLLAFRSVVIAVTAAVMNLLSVAAAYGVVAFFLEGGWAGRLIGIDTATPLAAFVPVIMFALLFGLSMDYEVFLISRMREAWVRTRDNGQAVTAGLASTGRVITAAAAIMIVVFAAIIPSDQIFIKVFGVGMVAAILIDATVIRMLLVPAVMHLLGRAQLVAAPRPGAAAAPAARRRTTQHVRTPPRRRGAGSRPVMRRRPVNSTRRSTILRRYSPSSPALMMLVLVAQFFLAASGAFDTAPKDESFQPHRALGYGIVLLAILLTIIAAVARMPGRLIGMTGLIAGLAVVQALIRAAADALNDTGDTSTTAGKLVFGLHAVNGLVILTVAGTVARRARALSRPAVADRPAGVGNDAGMSGAAAAGSAQPVS